MASVFDINSDECIIGRNIKKYREELGWSQTQLSDKADIERADISKYEGGTKGMPTIPILKKFAKALGIGVSDLLEGVETDEQKKQREGYDALSPENRKIIDQMISSLLFQQDAQSIKTA